ncbi:MAG: TrkH family potassium uptake protein [Lachnospiraceae bacterium]|nr:TrkH family potassium uptake protein [Lachnospiraceae bacterium]
MNFAIILSILSWVVLLQGALLILPCIVGFCYGETTDALVYLAIAALCILIGGLGRLKKTKNTTFYAKEGFLAVSFSWIVMSLIGALPFVFTGDIPNFTNALFEIISGFTTTGSSILTNVEALSHANLFWRSFSHWIGGMGVLVFILAIFPMSGGSTMNLMKAESPGPVVGKLVPKMQQTAFLLYAIYFAMTVIETILLLFGGMPLFDSLCHAFGTAGTGGFGIKNDSIAGYSTYLQVVITVFMFLFGVNFTFYYYILIRRAKDAFHLEEVRWYFYIFLIAVLTIAISLTCQGGSFGYNLQQSAFQVASVMTTTGYATSDFDLWPQICRTILVCLMFIGACAGSTGGGIKVSRILLYFKQIKKELKQQIHPRQISIVKMDGKAMEHSNIRSCNVYIMAYALIFVTSLLIISLDGFSFTTNFTAVSATLNNIGPGLEMVGPTGNFSEFSVLSKYVLMFNMLAGRLEVIPMLILFLPGTWRKV